MAGTPGAHGPDPPAGDSFQPEGADLARTAQRVQTVGQLGELLRRLRRQHARRLGTSPLTVRELAARSGYARGAIAEYLSGKTLPPTDRFDVLIRLLGAGRTEQGALATARDRVEERRRAPNAASPVPRELPPQVPDFTGRGQELAELDVLRPRAGACPTAPPASVIAGTAGVGKTALAIYWAHRVRASFPDGCLYLDLRGYHPDEPVTPADALAGLLRSLGVHGAKIPPGEAERSARYRTMVAGRRMLVVLDNARDTAHVEPLLPGEPPCTTLVTSRDALTDLVIRHGARRIDLGPVPCADAVALLGSLLGRRVDDEPDAAAALADQCDRLPLTLRLVAQLGSARPEATLAELASGLTDLRHRLSRLDSAGEPRTAIRAAFSWSYQGLTATAASAFRRYGIHPGYDIDAYAMAALAGTDLDHAQSLLQALVRAHLIQPMGAHRYGMHDLLRAYAAELAAADPEPERRAALTRLRDQQLYACVRAMDVVAPFGRDQRPTVVDPGWPTPRFADQQEAATWLDQERPNLLATALRADEPVGPAHVERLAQIIRYFLDTRGYYQDAELLFQRAAESATATSNQAGAMTSLGVVCWRLGRYQEAADYQERALRLAREAGDEREQGRALIGLGIVYWHLGRPGRTLELGQQALDLYRTLGDRHSQARTLGNLGIVHSRLGDYPAAQAHHRWALTAFRELGDEVGMARELTSLGSELQELGRLSEALAHLQRALAIAQRSGDRACEVAATDTLGLVYRRLGRLPEALDHHQQALQLARTSSDSQAEGYALSRLGAVYEHLGQLPQAIDLHHRGLRIAHAIGDDHLVADQRNRLGETLLAWPRPKQALRSFRRALTGAGQHGSRYVQARAHHGIARALTLLGSGSAASRHRERARELCTQLGIPQAGEVWRTVPGATPEAVGPAVAR